MAVSFETRLYCQTPNGATETEMVHVMRLTKPALKPRPSVATVTIVHKMHIPAVETPATTIPLGISRRLELKRMPQPFHQTNVATIANGVSKTIEFATRPLASAAIGGVQKTARPTANARNLFTRHFRARVSSSGLASGVQHPRRI